MTKSYFFYGVIDGEVTEDSWQALHAHFEKLARQDDDAGSQVTTKRKAVKRG